MKKQTITRKLSLSKKTVANLDEREMKKVKGGVRPSQDYMTCVSREITCGTNGLCTCDYSYCN